MNSEYTGILKCLYDWQTLITGLLALLAAYIAARPVWRQLTASARDTLVMRVSAIESKRDTTHQIINGITTVFLSNLRPYDDDQMLDPHPEWAFDAEQAVGSIVTTLKNHQETSLDGEIIDKKRTGVIQKCRALSDCLSNIHAPHSVEFGGPDGPAEEERSVFIERGRRAVVDLENQISAVVKAANELDVAFGVTLKQLRKRIIDIDV